jgi:hypothetical protein
MALVLGTAEQVNAERRRIEDTARAVLRGIAAGFGPIGSDLPFDQLVELVEALTQFVRALCYDRDALGPFFEDALLGGEFSVVDAMLLLSAGNPDGSDVIRSAGEYLDQHEVGWVVRRLPELTGLLDRGRTILRRGSILPVGPGHARLGDLQAILENERIGLFTPLFWQCCDPRTGPCARHGTWVALVERLWRNVDRAHSAEAGWLRAGRERETLTLRFTGLRDLGVEAHDEPDERYAQFVAGTWLRGTPPQRLIMARLDGRASQLAASSADGAVHAVGGARRPWLNWYP